MQLHEIRKALHGEAYDFLRTNPHLGSRVMLLGLGGSHAYGTDTETSDLDIRGCAVLSKAEILCGESFEQVTDVATDTTIYAFPKLIHLLKDCNPNTIELIGKEDIHYFRDEKVKIRYHWHVNADVKNVGIRFEIRNENDVPTATSVGYNLYKGKAGDRAELNCLYDLSILAPGRYKTVFTVFEKSSYGLGADLDCVFAMDLIVEEPTLSNLAWDAKHWGNIILPEPVLVGGD